MQEIPIVLIGHKDHGKSTLIGRLVLDTKSIKESRYQEVKEVDESCGRQFELAHLVDSFKEEREREMTMDTTRAFLKGKERNYQLIDVPGHAELIANMLTGASNAKGAILLASIQEGIEEQTRQHLEIAKLLGILQLGVAINKMDSIEFKQSAFEEMKGQIEQILKEIGYNLEKIQFFPISARGGDNVVEKSSQTSWYTGPTIMEYLEREIAGLEDFSKLPFSFLIQDKYEEAGQEVLVGQVQTGQVNIGQEIIFLPQNQKLKIQEIRDSEGEIKKAEAGQNIGLVVLNSLPVFRGSVGVLEPGQFLTSNKLAGEIFWIEKPSKADLILECGTAQVSGILQDLESAKEGTKTNYNIFLEKPVVFDSSGKTILGKIVLKNKGKIIAVGNIL